ncbi:unnamed protein product [Peniophora sp. CBMAI 1063]|nr:unnamed protein product [Peniophora sp. CBMAI 1063]
MPSTNNDKSISAPSPDTGLSASTGGSSASTAGSAPDKHGCWKAPGLPDLPANEKFTTMDYILCDTIAAINREQGNFGADKGHSRGNSNVAVNAGSDIFVPREADPRVEALCAQFDAMNLRFRTRPRPYRPMTGLNVGHLFMKRLPAACMLCQPSRALCSHVDEECGGGFKSADDDDDDIPELE